ncbi:MAG: hypothetical protein AAFQ98_03340, partial [Bacteroidota bacterium]
MPKEPHENPLPTQETQGSDRYLLYERPVGPLSPPNQQTEASPGGSLPSQQAPKESPTSGPQSVP